MKNAVYYIVFSLFLSSCAGGGNRGTSAGKSAEGRETASALPVLDMEYAHEHVDEADTSFVWNDLIENERFIPLETKVECLVGGGWWTVARLGTDFLISHIPGRKPVFRFDSSGRFVQCIAQPGRGPGEIMTVLTNVIPFQNDRYIMFDTGYQTVIKDRDGNWIRDLFNGRYRPLYPHDSGFVCVNQYQRFPNDSTFLCFTDSLGNVVKELKEPGEKRISPEESGVFENLDLRDIYFTDEKLWMTKSYNDTLFRITSERTIEPHLILHRGKYAPSLEDGDKERIGAADYKEIGPYSIIVSAAFQIWNRETGKLVGMGRFNSGGIRYRLPDNRLITVYLKAVQDGQLIFEPAFEDIYEYLNLREDDNPVLMVADLKKID